ncbi:polysaccharide lyase 6 family protein [Paenibacillus xerothermodurans]|uniref:Lyase n=1 Tax=Paenibacillus xerothermodurans TaxID=1977292 RepID=A0A2W1P3H3_PAEXE|nr:polysaccharide lyase 6 family protein [Paenibacillus xerothermodurans]PZE21718.1 lyase [Paenibacillus xerothermodurans]
MIRKKMLGLTLCMSLTASLMPTVVMAAEKAEADAAAASVTGNVYWDNSNGTGLYGDLPYVGSFAIVYVSNSEQLTAAIAKVSAGTLIILADGSYTNSGPFVVQSKNGTKEKPILIRALHRGKAEITGGAYFEVKGSSHIILDGLKFTNTDNTSVVLDASNNVRVTRSTFALKENGKTLKWLQIKGQNSHHNRIDHNEFGPRRDLGQMISIEGHGSQVSQYDTIEYNYFHDSAHQTANGGETIRVGLSGLSMSDGFITVQHNLFVNCNADPEVISVKSGHNTIRYNTFINNAGQVTARHGHNNSYYGNFFIGDGVKPGVGGFRLYGNDQKVYNNYLANLTADAISIDGGDFDAGPEGKEYTNANLTAHWRIYRAQVTNNTVVNSTTGIVLGRSYKFAPVDSVVANNIVKNSSGTLYNEVKQVNTAFEGNIGYGSTVGNVPRTEAEIRNVDPLLVEVNGLHKISANSPAIDAAVGSYPYVTEDMDGQKRSANDVGADEYSKRLVWRAPLTPAHVGPNSIHIPID